MPTVYNKQNITLSLMDMNFNLLMFKLILYLTGWLCSLVRYRLKLWNIKFLSKCGHVIFFIYVIPAHVSPCVFYFFNNENSVKDMHHSIKVFLFRYCQMHWHLQIFWNYFYNKVILICKLLKRFNLHRINTSF